MQSRVIGGNKADRNSWPWQVAIYDEFRIKKEDFFCGGSIISPYCIVTAAHCVFDEKGKVDKDTIFVV